MYKNISSNSLKYHTSWDWQVEVWSKVAHLLREKAARYLLNTVDYQIFLNRFESAIFSNKKEMGFNTLVEAVKKLNELNAK
jgi:Zn-dependent M32 family carboxypeptidase